MCRLLTDNDYDSIYDYDTHEWTSSQTSEYQLIKGSRPIDVCTLAEGLAVLGPDWTPSGSVWEARGNASATLLTNDLGLSRVMTAALNTTVQLCTEGLQLMAQATWPSSLASQRDSLVRVAVSSITARLRISGRQAYVAYPGGSPDPIPVYQQAAAVSVLTRHALQEQGQLIEKLVNYVVATPECYSSISALPMSLALLEADLATGSATPDVDVAASVGNSTVLEADFRPGGGQATASASTAYPEAIEQTGVAIAAAGTGQVRTADYLSQTSCLPTLGCP
jgi:hypothetical protein